MKISENADLAKVVSNDLVPSTTETNPHWQTKNDAYRHAYWNAINTRDFGYGFAKIWADAHESEDPPAIQLETQMDFWNNEVGRDLADLDFPDASKEELKAIVLSSP